MGAFNLKTDSGLFSEESLKTTTGSLSRGKSGVRHHVDQLNFWF